MPVQEAGKQVFSAYFASACLKSHRGQWGQHPRKQPAQMYALERGPAEAAWPVGKHTAGHQRHALCLLRGAHCGGVASVIALPQLAFEVKT